MNWLILSLTYGIHALKGRYDDSWHSRMFWALRSFYDEFKNLFPRKNVPLETGVHLLFTSIHIHNRIKGIFKKIISNSTIGSFINQVDMVGKRGRVVKCPYYYISLFRKMVDKGVGVKMSKKLSTWFIEDPYLKIATGGQGACVSKVPLMGGKGV